MHTVPYTSPSIPVPVADHWTVGVERLQHMPALPGFLHGRWVQIQRDCAWLLERHGTHLRELGWTAEDLFGVHPDAPAADIRRPGVGLLLCGGRVARITPQTARIIRPNGAVLGFTRCPDIGAVPIWAVE